MGLFRKKNKQAEQVSNNSDVDLSQVSDADFWTSAQDIIQSDTDEKVFGQNILETFSKDDALSAENADSARFRLANPGYLESQVDDFVADVVDTLKYYEELVLKLHNENEALNDHVNHLRNMIEVFRVQGRVDMDDSTADMIKQAPTGQPTSTFVDNNDINDFDDSPFGSGNDAELTAGSDESYQHSYDFPHQYEHNNYPQTNYENNSNLDKQRPMAQRDSSNNLNSNNYEHNTGRHNNDEEEYSFGSGDNFSAGFPTAIDDE